MFDLRAEQEKLELSVSIEAEVRANKEYQESNQRTDFSSSRLGLRFVKSIMNQPSTEGSPSFLQAVNQFINPPIKRTAGRNIITSKLLQDSGLEPEVVSLIAARTILNYIVKNRTCKRSSLCMYIGRQLDLEVSIRRFGDTKERKSLLKKLFKDFDKRTYPKHWRIKTIRNYFDAEQIEWSTWEPKQQLAIGMALIGLFRNATGLIEFSHDGMFIDITETLSEHIQKMLVNNSSMFVLYRPTIIPPKPWSETNLFRGGYYTNKVRPYPLIKGSGRRDVERLMRLDLSKVLRAVNALQETPWRINTRMLEVQRWAFNDYGKSIGSFEGSDEESMPPIPFDYETNLEVKKAHNRACFEVYDRRRRAKSKRISAMVSMAVADEMKRYDRIYFPHTLDSRGRAYPVSAFLHPQGPDYCKSLLEFGEGKPVETQEAANWLAVCGANAYGYDKVSLVERVEWVAANEEMILSCAANYQTDHRWMQAGEPFQFLRFCFEWEERVKGLGFLSHMVIPLDATNSGLQHYSAMLRDEVGGRSVNLVPGLPRQDVYGDVAKRVIEMLMEDGGVEAHGWVKFGIDRKITKRQVMVVPYAGKFTSCLEYTRQAVVDKLATGVEKPQWAQDPKEFQERILYLARFIWKAIDETVIKGKEAMTWLSLVASGYAKAVNATGAPVYERRMSWLTPDGFEVVHFREDETMHRVKTTFEGSVFLSYYRGVGKLNTKDMALACPPNFVHALDATHLRMTINKALDIGLTDFGMVHDSFGTHAANVSRFLSECVKPAFVEMYTDHDVIGEFAERFKEQSADLPLPTKGSLDLNGVLQSEFFFS
jgi:DNA-directed RNA polymerase